MGRAGPLLLALASVALGLAGANLRPARATGTSGDLDLGFGLGGAATAAGHFTDAVAARGSDGAVATGGSRVNGTFNGSSTEEWVLRRFTATGQADTSFASGGLFTRYGQYGVDRVYATGFDASGRLVAVGTAKVQVVTGTGRKATTSYPTRGVVVRLDAAGALDTSFGVGGEVVLDFPVFALQLQGDGRIVVAGQRNGDPAVARLLASGALDSTYGVGGIAVDARFADTCGRVMSVAVQNSGATVLGWRGTRTTKSKGGSTSSDVWYVTRMSAGGAADPAFLTTARVDHLIGGLVVGPDDRIFASGHVGAAGAREIVVNAYDEDGDPDASFAIGGVARWASHLDQASVGAPVLQADGRLVLPSHFDDGPWEAAPVRLLADGTLDASFGPLGEGAALSLGTGVQTWAWGLALAPDGGVLMVGTYVGAPSGGYVARYLP